PEFKPLECRCCREMGRKLTDLQLRSHIETWLDIQRSRRLPGYIKAGRKESRLDVPHIAPFRIPALSVVPDYLVVAAPTGVFRHDCQVARDLGGAGPCKRRRGTARGRKHTAQSTR
ncbi:hypothetical protein HPB47_023748, partial [Ixodes persulcatus]